MNVTTVAEVGRQPPRDAYLPAHTTLVSEPHRVNIYSFLSRPPDERIQDGG